METKLTGESTLEKEILSFSIEVDFPWKGNIWGLNGKIN